jgi:hypothetical protein
MGQRPASAQTVQPLAAPAAQPASSPLSRLSRSTSPPTSITQQQQHYPPSCHHQTPFLQPPLSCTRQTLDRATTDLTTDHCHCHLTAASLYRQLTATHLLPHSNSSASLSDRIRLAQQASLSQPNYQHIHQHHVWTRKTRPVSRRDHEGHQAHPRRSRPWPPSRCCCQGRRGHRCPSWRCRQEDQGS